MQTVDWSSLILRLQTKLVQGHFTAFPLGNLPLSHSPFNLNLSFYYNCSHYPSSGVPPIECLSSGASRSFVFLMGNETEGFDCQEKVVVAVLKDQITSHDDGGLINEFAGAMNEGFLLDWQTTTNCAECEASNGTCGYSNTRKETLCFCKDGTTKSNTCQGIYVWQITTRLSLCFIIWLIMFCFNNRGRGKQNRFVKVNYRYNLCLELYFLVNVIVSRV